MVPVKTMREYDMLQDLTVLFCECVVRALKLKLLTQDMLDDYDPALMFTIPRLAIVWSVKRIILSFYICLTIFGRDTSM